jgi:general secretion pathway protein G
MLKSYRRKPRGEANGFTLIELMVVVAIIAILASIVAPRMVQRAEKAKRAAARVQIANLKTALINFRMDTGDFPTTDQGLEALIKRPTGYDAKYQEGGYLDSDRVPLDPWRNPYVYICPGIHDPSGHDIESYGKDGADGGQGDDKDIESWHLQED